MTRRYQALLFTPEVRAAQARERSPAALGVPEAGEIEEPDRLGPEEIAFLRQRDSVYIASVGASGWPYVQHRGGPPGFLRVLGPDRIAFADLRGNRQYISLGNFAGDDRVALFAVDYPRRARLKLLGRVRVGEPDEVAEVMAAVEDPRWRARVERVLVIAVGAFDWNCPQGIVPRWTAEEIAPAMERLESRIAELEAEVARLKDG
ncbi:pyridoxamine 5'-phosphate oxidase family protein [Rubellimicrobium roseum]|uniref:Pyridoxamine 5-phosphate oxidase n=1 Tax=Rubellimicrobium roseum TaxID=687525 RepID=A0A5C4NJX7_9RHOB|nr:pyridoxamine 5'-phosphate oxidase family protein [Rubellimicrobium roseum]TNC72977.1 pyridoxamine 5-phosphate oxidase [Rubellimicrobium roseum]